MRHTSVFVLASTTACLGACGDGGVAAPEAIGTVQQEVPVAEFMALVAADPALADALALGGETIGSDVVLSAGKLADSDGVTLDYGVLRDEASGLVEVVRRCAAGACVAVLQEPVAGSTEDVTWRNRSGPVPIAGLAMPFQLRDIADDAHPDESAVLAVAARALDGGKADGAPATTSKVRILNAFNKTIGARTDLEVVATRLRKTLPDTTVRYNATKADLDQALSTLGPQDVLVLISHADYSKTAGRVTGVTVNSNFWGTTHYGEERIVEMLAANPNAGPGFILFGACKSAELLPTFDSGARVVMGFTDSITPAEFARVMEEALKALGEGKDIKAALAAGNSMLAGTVQLEPNAHADVTRKLTIVPGADGQCNKADLAARWRGTAEDADHSTGMLLDFVLADFGDNADGSCKGCWIPSLTLDGVKLAGCAHGSSIELTRVGNDPPWFSLDLTVVTHDQLKATATGDFPQGVHGLVVTRTYSGNVTRQQ